ncbi:MMPL family transporter [Actinokineospora sp. UTMC 2448]|uniref:MMPL family transporter n=1 Tax=Actinokineospora sp. UTMC 2448 TaxID=2268449 RepID=UPI00216417B6|nr:MMPL family transporter [Actinokineospora sp. UTMC 2448]UVS80711.1 Membrane protein YdfJ [Actinokineospora sp. UTMC 2448]
MRRLAIFCHRRAGWVVAVWLAVLAGLTVGSALAGPDHQDIPTLPASDSSRAQELLGGQGGVAERVVFSGALDRARIEPVLGELARLPGVVAVVSPFEAPQQVSPRGGIAYATVTFADPGSVDLETARDLVGIAEAASGGGLTVAVDGPVAARTIAPPSVHDSGLGLLAAAVVLLLAFGSLMAMLLPLVTAAVSVGSAAGVVGLLTHLVPVPTVSLEIVALLGLGVGVDYALFVVTRYRQELRSGASPEEALGTAASTSGRGVLFAGVTVCVSLMGMLTVGIDFLDGIAFSASIAVLMTMLAALTLLPALLRPFGRRLAPKARHRRYVPEGRGWAWLARGVTRRPGLSTAAALVIIGVLALPAAALRLGVPDAGVHPEGSTTRVAYDLLAEGFGPGFAGPLVVVGRVQDPVALERVHAAVSTRDDVELVAPPSIHNGVGAFVVQPKGTPQDPATAELVRSLREDIIPASGGEFHVGGNTAVQADFSTAITDRLPLFLGTVVAISFVLLVIVFRSLLIPLTAAVMNLLAAAAMFGALTAVFQLGWFGSGPTGPIEPYIPVFLFAGLFGLSMDYEVFLVTRIQEEWRKGHDTVTATVRGLASTGRTITAAALIMALVFVSFVPAGDRVVQETGLGLTVAVLLDAVVIRAFLVPAVMAAFGRANWWLPGFVDRALPRLDVEGHAPDFDWFRPAREPVGSGV